MQHNGKLDSFLFIGPLFRKKHLPREQLLHNNNTNGSLIKYFNKHTDIYNTARPRDTIARHWPKVNSVCFEDPYDHINPMENKNDETHLIYEH